jgi:fermentation-respiration switch protein FrsA (DUF1100 family)
MIWIIIIAALILTAAALSYYAYRKAFLSDRKRQEDWDGFIRRAGEEGPQVRELMEQLKGITAEDVFINSFDGLKLHGRYYHVKDGAPLDIQFHGYNGNAMRDFCGGNKISRESGHNSLLIDQRAHGMSRGKTISFGINERKDCLSWVRYAVERFGEDTEIVLSGVSMGAATVLMASDLGLPKNVKAIVADCGYSSPKAIINKVMRDSGLPDKLMYPFVWLGAMVFGKFNLTESSAVSAVSESDVPILIIHGGADDFVPCYMAEEIYKACRSEKKLLIVPGAGHGMSYLVDKDLYEKTVKDFIKI